jgi:hypothetical protein
LYQITEADVDTSTGEVHRWHDRYRLLQKYSGDPSVFVHFSDVNKLGVNPSSSFNTPIGVYGYPVDYVLDPPRGTGTPFNVPFAGNRQYAHVFRVRDLDRCLVVSDDSGDGDFMGGVLDFIDRFFHSYPIRDSIQSIFLPNAVPAGILRSDRFNVLELYNHIIDENYDINVPSNLPKFPSEYKVGRIVGGKLGRTKLAAICLVMRYIASSTNHSSDTILLWCFTMAAASIRSSQIRRSSGLKSKSSVVWSGIMRDLGVSGIIDQGFGLIHSNEPTQAVFFDVRDLIHLDVIRNTYAARSPNNSTLYDITILARYGDFSFINTLIKGNFSGWVNSTIDNASKRIPNELINGLVNNNEHYLFGPWWVYLTNLATTLRNVINMDAKKLIICKKNGGEKYMEIRPTIINNINDGVKLIRNYFDDFKAWLDTNARGDMGGWFSGENSKTGYDDLDLVSIRSNVDDLYKSMARLERAA